jgi:hypothetical protein
VDTHIYAKSGRFVPLGQCTLAHGRGCVNAIEVATTVARPGLRSGSAVPVHEARQENTNGRDRNVKCCRIKLSQTGDERAVDPARTHMGGGAMS